MQPLLKIQTIPIKIEAQTKRASLQHSTDPVPAPRPVRPAQRSVPAPQQRQVKPEPQPEQRVNQQAPRGAQRNTAADTGNYLQEASNAVNAHNQTGVVAGSAAPEVAYTPVSNADFPQTPVVDTAPVQTPASTSFDYNMDRETFDWNANAKPQLEYVPGSIEYSISQYPEVVIEYVGEPIYVPASANPNYVPPPETKGKA